MHMLDEGVKIDFWARPPQDSVVSSAVLETSHLDSAACLNPELRVSALIPW